MLRPGIPISDAGQDKLGRSRFSKALAAAITGYQDPSSLVVGLYGSWGTGKSSLLNMLESDLKPFADRLILVRFNPWNYSDRDALLQHFLSELGARLDTSDNNELKSAAKFVDDLSTVISPLSTLIPYGKVANDVVKGLGTILSQRAKELGSVQAVKYQISSALVASERKVVVIIDDIDRLTSEEIRQVFQLVKSVADFSNVIYVLSFDKKLVVKALADVQKGDGDAYLDKIVNIPFEIPRITQKQMRSLLDAELSRFAALDEDYTWQSDRLTQVLDAVSRQFETIRALDRFSNVLEFTASLVKGEVDYADFIGLTALQISDPLVFEYIRDHGEAFTFGHESSESVDVEQNHNAWEKLMAIAKTERAVELASLVFPKASGDDEDEAEDGDEPEFNRATVLREARACANVTILDRYFQLVVSEDDVPRKQIRGLLAATKSIEDTEAELARLRSQVGLRSIIDRLEDSDLSRLDALQLRNLIHSLLKLFMTVDPTVRQIYRGIGSRLLMRLLRLIGDDNDRYNVLSSLLDSDVGTALPLLSIIAESSRETLGITRTSRREPPLFTNEQALPLKKAAASKIAEAMRRSPPPDWLTVDLVRVLYFWRLSGGLSSVRDFVKDVVDRGDRALIAMLIQPPRFRKKASLAEAAAQVDDYVDSDVLIRAIAELLGRLAEELSTADTTQVQKELLESDPTYLMAETVAPS